MPDNTAVIIEEGTWPVLPIFQVLQREGNIEKSEMYRTFNMGIGFVLIVDQANAVKVMDYCQANNEPIYMIGMVAQGNKEVIIK